MYLFIPTTIITSTLYLGTNYEKTWEKNKRWHVNCAVFAHSLHRSNSNFANLALSIYPSFQDYAKRGELSDEYISNDSAVRVAKQETNQSAKTNESVSSSAPTSHLTIVGRKVLDLNVHSRFTTRHFNAIMGRYMVQIPTRCTVNL